MPKPSALRSRQKPPQKTNRAAMCPPQGTKSRIAAGVLAILFGVFGVHNFYIGKTGLGIAQLAITVCSCGTLAIVSEIWGIIEGVRLLQGTIYTDGHGMKFVD